MGKNALIFGASLPGAMIATIIASVVAVLLLAGFVLYMWINQEKSAMIAREVQNITNQIGAGIVDFIAGGDGYITYASKGFYTLLGYSMTEIHEEFKNGFFNLLEDKYAEFMRTVEAGPDVSINEEMKINTKWGSKWVLVTGNAVQRKKIYTMSVVLVDITNEKLLNEQLIVEEERYKLVTELSNDVIFNYSIADDVISVSDNFISFFGDSTSFADFNRNKRWEKDFVYEEDREKFAELFRILTVKGDKVDEQVRLKDKKNVYIWCRIIAMPVRNQNGEAREIVGKIINIDLHKRELARLETKAMRDPLTGAYNKEYTKLLIERYMRENAESNGMLFIVDIDKFKQVNDTYGHIMGDNIIVEVVKQITKSFRSNDIIGRIGGDEFAVFVCNVKKKEDQIKQALKLHEVLRSPAVIGDKVIPKSASIGVAMFPDHGSSYERLVECADKALYAVKGNGRDNFIIYDESFERVKHGED
ncbi:MAG: sensor domain-containing diguanylate cyclase [Lachnospiraceae bacterium]|nr:sensor domain-containing diguanylate cyclase [Lachnospiraceae bacterium]